MVVKFLLLLLRFNNGRQEKKNKKFKIYCPRTTHTPTYRIVNVSVIKVISCFGCFSSVYCFCYVRFIRSLHMVFLEMNVGLCSICCLRLLSIFSACFLSIKMLSLFLLQFSVLIGFIGLGLKCTVLIAYWLDFSRSLIGDLLYY